MKLDLFYAILQLLDLLADQQTSQKILTKKLTRNPIALRERRGATQARRLRSVSLSAPLVYAFEIWRDIRQVRFYDATQAYVSLICFP